MYKKLFLFNNKTIYLDNGASTPILKSNLKVANQFLKNYGSIHRGVGFNSEQSTLAYERARECISKCLQLKNRDIIFCNNTTDAINKLSMYLSNIKDKVYLSEKEHSSNLLPWLQMFSKKNVSFIEQVPLNTIKNSIISLAKTNNVTGLSISDEVLRSFDKSNLIVIDGSQHAPHFKIEANQFDAYALSGHKMYCPMGISLFTFNRDLISLNEITRLQTGGGNVSYVSKELVPTYKESPHCFEIGTPNGVGAVCLGNTFDTLYNKIGIENIEKHTFSLANKIFELTKKHKACLQNKGIYILNEFNEETLLLQSPIITLVAKNQKELIDKLRKKYSFREGNFCSYRVIEEYLSKLSFNEEKVIRFSFGLINDVYDVETLFEDLLRI